MRVYHHVLLTFLTNLSHLQANLATILRDKLAVAWLEISIDYHRDVTKCMRVAVDKVAVVLIFLWLCNIRGYKENPRWK